MTVALPFQFRLTLDRSVVRRGKTLAGGAPRRVLRLSPAGWRTLRALEAGTESSAVGRALARRLLDAGIAHPRPARRDTVRDVTVVVPVKDRHDELDRCLASLGAGTNVIVADDGSREPEALAAVAVRHRARVVRRPVSGGPAAARNAALGEVATELIAFLDSDCVAPPEWLQALAGHFDDPLVGAVAPRVRAALPARGEPGFVQRYLAARSPLDMGPHPAGVEPGGRVSYVPTAALLVRRRALASGFDERLRYGEDVDLVWRLRDAGWRIRYDPGVAVSHSEPVALRRALARRFRYGTSAAPLAIRHPGRLAPAVLPAWPTLVALLVVARRPVAAGVIACRQSATLAARVRPLGLERAWGARWFGEATYQALLSLARYVTTFALPAGLAYASARRRPSVLVLLALPALDAWRRSETTLGPLTWTTMALADDAAYGAGVAWGCLRTGTVRPLVPSVSAVRRDREVATGLQPVAA